MIHQKRKTQSIYCEPDWCKLTLAVLQLTIGMQWPLKIFLMLYHQTYCLQMIKKLVDSQTTLVWKSNKARDPLGRNLFPIMRPTRSINCVNVPGSNTLATKPHDQGQEFFFRTACCDHHQSSQISSPEVASIGNLCLDIVCQTFPIREGKITLVTKSNLFIKLYSLFTWPYFFSFAITIAGPWPQ